MTTLTIEVPDAWISEYNVLYLVHQHPVGMPVLAERANREPDYYCFYLL